MKRLVLLALLALALPLAAFANTVDFTSNNGTLAGSIANLSLMSTITAINGVPGPMLGTASFMTGKLVGGNLTTGGTFAFAGSAFTITLPAAVGNLPAGVIFNGAFTTPIIWAPVPHQPGYYTIEGSVAGTWFNGTHVTGFTSQVYLVKFDTGSPPTLSGTFGSGDTFIVTTAPEPGTLGLLGTGLVGLAGVIRKKLKTEPKNSRPVSS